MEKIIFVDVDGVLNDAVTFMETCDDTPSKPHLDCLKEIVDKTDAKIVLSSTWRLFNRSFKIVKDSLATVGLEVFDRTIELTNRADEINDWLSKHPDVERFVILDDEPISHSFPKNLVQTTFSKGLLPEHVEKAIKILNN